VRIASMQTTEITMIIDPIAGSLTVMSTDPW